MRQTINNPKKLLLSLMSFIFMLLSTTRYDAALSDPPTFSELQPILIRIINILIMSAGIILVALIAYGVWKSSLATGDPRGLEGAKSTWTYATYGFFIVVGVFAILMIVEGVIGVSTTGGLVKNFVDSIVALMNIQSSP